VGGNLLNEKHLTRLLAASLRDGLRHRPEPDFRQAGAAMRRHTEHVHIEALSGGGYGCRHAGIAHDLEPRLDVPARSDLGDQLPQTLDRGNVATRRFLRRCLSWLLDMQNVHHTSVGNDSVRCRLPVRRRGN
jgi:hypothetical protein